MWGFWLRGELWEGLCVSQCHETGNSKVLLEILVRMEGNYSIDHVKFILILLLLVKMMEANQTIRVRLTWWHIWHLTHPTGARRLLMLLVALSRFHSILSV